MHLTVLQFWISVHDLRSRCLRLRRSSKRIYIGGSYVGFVQYYYLIPTYVRYRSLERSSASANLYNSVHVCSGNTSQHGFYRCHCKQCSTPLQCSLRFCPSALSTSTLYQFCSQSSCPDHKGGITLHSGRIPSNARSVRVVLDHCQRC